MDDFLSVLSANDRPPTTTSLQIDPKHINYMADLAVPDSDRGNKDDRTKETIVLITTVLKASAGASSQIIKEATSTCLMLIGTVKNMRYNKSAFLELLGAAANVIHTIYAAEQAAPNPSSWISQPVKEILEELLRTLADLEKSIHEHVKRNRALRFIHNTEDQRTIEVFRGRFEQALSKFQVQSHVRINHDLTHIIQDNQAHVSALAQPNTGMPFPQPAMHMPVPTVGSAQLPPTPTPMPVPTIGPAQPTPTLAAIVPLPPSPAPAPAPKIDEPPKVQEPEAEEEEDSSDYRSTQLRLKLELRRKKKAKAAGKKKPQKARVSTEEEDEEDEVEEEEEEVKKPPRRRPKPRIGDEDEEEEDDDFDTPSQASRPSKASSTSSRPSPKPGRKPRRSSTQDELDDDVGSLNNGFAGMGFGPGQGRPPPQRHQTYPQPPNPYGAYPPYGGAPGGYPPYGYYPPPPQHPGHGHYGYGSPQPFAGFPGGASPFGAGPSVVNIGSGNVSGNTISNIGNDYSTTKYRSKKKKHTI